MSQTAPALLDQRGPGYAFAGAKMVNGHRYRTPEGKIYPSVTTILQATKHPVDGGELEVWGHRVGHDVADYVMRRAAEIGTQAHRLNEDYVMRRAAEIGTQAHRLNEDYVMRRQSGKSKLLLARAHHENFRPYLDRMEAYGVEVPLYSDGMRIAGTADCIAKYDGTLSVIDYKTKRSPQREEWLADYYMQAAAYAMMFYGLTGIEIRQGVILVSSEQDTMQEFVTDLRKHADAFAGRLAAYDVKHRAAQEAEWLDKYGNDVGVAAERRP